MLVSEVAPARPTARVVIVAVVVAAPLDVSVVVAAQAPAAPLPRRVALVVLVAPAGGSPVAPLVPAPARARLARVKVVVPVATVSRHPLLPKRLRPDDTRAPSRRRRRDLSRRAPPDFNFYVEGNWRPIILACREITSRG